MRRIFVQDGTLTPYLEAPEHGFRLCIHSRNFIAGPTILTNIQNAINTSRRMILLLTQ